MLGYPAQYQALTVIYVVLSSSEIRQQRLPGEQGTNYRWYGIKIRTRVRQMEADMFL